MKKINSFTLLLIVTVLMVILMLITIQRPNNDGDDYTLLYPELLEKLGRVDKITFNSAEQDAFTLGRSEESEDWVVTDLWDYPADFNKVKRALIDVAEARILEQKTSNPEHYGLLGVQKIEDADPGARQVTLYEGDVVVASLIVGNQRETNSTSGPSQHYVRRAEQAESWLVQGYLQLNSAMLNWIDSLVFHVERERVHHLVITQPTGQSVAIVNIGKQGEFGVPNMPAGTSFKYKQLGYDIAGVYHELQLEEVLPIADFSRGNAEVVRAEYVTFDGLKIRSETSFIDGQYFATFHAEYDSSAVQAAPEDIQALNVLKTADAVQQEAVAINAKVSPWAYRLAGFVGTNLMRAESDIVTKSEQRIPMPADVTGGFGGAR